MDKCQNFKNYFDYLSDCLEMIQEEITTMIAPITDDEIFIIEDFNGSGDVFTEDLVAPAEATVVETTGVVTAITTTKAVTTAKAISTMVETTADGVNKTAITTTTVAPTTQAISTMVETTADSVITTAITTTTTVRTEEVNTMAALMEANSTTGMAPIVETTGNTLVTPSITAAMTTTPSTSTIPSATSMDMLWPLIGCSASGWIGLAFFICYLCKRRQNAPADADDSSVRLSPGETLV